MKSLKREIMTYVSNYSVNHDEQKILETIKISRQAFYKSEREQFLSYPEFIYQQSLYIHKRWWILQGIILFCLWWIMNISKTNFYVQRSMGILAPLFVILLIPELYKNQNYSSTEIECSTYYSLRQVYAARMILFALVDLLLLTLFFLVVTFTIKLGMATILVQFFIPFNVTCCICFRTLYSRKGSGYYALLLCMFWVALWVLVVLNESIYTSISVTTWGAMVFLSVLYLGYSILRLWRNCENIWEVNPSWN